MAIHSSTILPGKSHGQRSLLGYSPWGCKESDMTERLHYSLCWVMRASQVVIVEKNPPANAGDIRDAGLIPGSEDPLEEGMATHSSTLAWRIPWTEKPGGLRSIGSQRVRHN